MTIEKQSVDQPELVSSLPNIICKSGLVLLEGKLILTKGEIRLINARQIRERVDANYLKGEELSKNKGATNDTPSDSKSESSEAVAVSIPIEYIESMTFENTLGSPSLLLKWEDQSRSFGRTKKIQFIQRGKSFSKNERIATWIPLIDELKNAKRLPVEDTVTRKEETIQDQPEEENREIDPKKLREELLFVLDEKDWKGLFQIVKDLRDRFGSDYDFDDVEMQCRRLAESKAIEEDKVGGFFKKSKK